MGLGQRLVKFHPSACLVLFQTCPWLPILVGMVSLLLLAFSYSTLHLGISMVIEEMTVFIEGLRLMHPF